MSSVNKVILIGNLGRDPELRHTQGGKAVCNLSIATTFKDETEWHRVVVWERQAENCEKYLSKGSSVYVEGRLQTRSWEDDNGVKKNSTDIVAHVVQFLGSKDSGERRQDDGRSSSRKGNSDSGRERQRPAPTESPNTPDYEDDIPF